MGGGERLDICFCSEGCFSLGEMDNVALNRCTPPQRDALLRTTGIR